MVMLAEGFASSKGTCGSASEVACAVVQTTADALSSVPCAVRGSLEVIAGTSVHAKADAISNLLVNT